MADVLDLFEELDTFLSEFDMVTSPGACENSLPPEPIPEPQIPAPVLPDPPAPELTPAPIPKLTPVASSPPASTPTSSTAVLRKGTGLRGKMPRTMQRTNPALAAEIRTRQLIASGSAPKTNGRSIVRIPPSAKKPVPSKPSKYFPPRLSKFLANPSPPVITPNPTTPASSSFEIRVHPRNPLKTIPVIPHNLPPYKLNTLRPRGFKAKWYRIEVMTPNGNTFWAKIPKPLAERRSKSDRV